jgi:TRAP-type C4-dicarboxylate transport system substrate-binding protein
MRWEYPEASARFFCGLFMAVFALAPRAEADAVKYNLRWVLVHDPSVAASAAAEHFASRVEKETNGEIHVEIIHRDAYAARRGIPMTRRRLLTDLVNGKFEIGQVITSDLAHFNPQLWALGQPYLFRDYDHAEAVFEGPLGARILSLLPGDRGARALGITYSGGFGVIATKDREIRRPEDMKRLKLMTERFAWLHPLVWLTKVEPISAPMEAFVPMSAGGFADAVETTIARFDEYGQDRGAKIVNVTDHYLLTTMLVVNEKFYESLPETDRQIVARAALDTAREERALSIKANEDGRVNLEKRGVRFVDLTDAEKAHFAQVLQPMYSVRLFQAGNDLVKAIRETTATKTAQR